MRESSIVDRQKIVSKIRERLEHGCRISEAKIGTPLPNLKLNLYEFSV